ncbi:P-loop containing nucleoside triphosphate hydrolase protein [Lojkania enalia]|uniref:ATP-dependent RNA helicase SUV3, mitochondrial n=1 Tax=Lojkania enalia TaxID=147567 RepID=A0A9P4KC05_9PLEO|nr:P-loop containing nucleoside triphosphate hydrolase protein [Didymosphaeria enalia]
MPTRAAQRPSLCMFCAFAACKTPPRSFLPRVQVANRSQISSRPSFLRKEDLANPNPLRKALKAFRNNPFETIRKRMQLLYAQMQSLEYQVSLQLTPKQFEQEWIRFERSVISWTKKGSPELRLLQHDTGRGTATVDLRLRYLFHAQVIGQRFTQAELENQKHIADLRYPTEWYPATRQISRTVHLHVGPTNSGKTYHALKRLEEVEKGIYLGPLRLLAHEVYTRLQAKGRRCALVTGEEQRIPEGEDPDMWSCTVEMAPLNKELDVAVIDEIQMINHQERGWAWTQAYLGIQAKEIHLCGEARTVPIIRELAALTGDKVKVHTYKRLTPLQVADRSLKGDLRRLEKGDCIVCFSVLGIHAMRREIEQKTGRKCAIVYGSLPPETRAQQARLFNDPDNDYDFLVASDAIGMGLNLSIKRVILEATMKNNGQKFVPLTVSEVKQIAGRAGRYRTAHQAISKDTEKALQVSGGLAIGLEDEQSTSKLEQKVVGFVTTLHPYDHTHLRTCMEREPEAIRTAGLFPPSVTVERFSSYFPPGTPFSYILLRLHEICEIHPRFHLCALKDQLTIADTIHPVQNLTVQDRLVFCAAPSNLKTPEERHFLRALARCVADNESGNILDLPRLPLEILDTPLSGEREYLWSLEQLHKMVVLYLWLSFRFPNVFTTRELAKHIKSLIEERIEETLDKFNFTETGKRAAQRRKMREAQIRQDKADRALKSQQLFQDQVDNSYEATGVTGHGSEDVRRAMDVLESDDSPRDDEDEYPTPELANLDVEGLDSLRLRHQQRTRYLSQQVQGMKKGHAGTINMSVQQPDATQPRA